MWFHNIGSFGVDHFHCYWINCYDLFHWKRSCPHDFLMSKRDVRGLGTLSHWSKRDALKRNLMPTSAMSQVAFLERAALLVGERVSTRLLLARPTFIVLRGHILDRWETTARYPDSHICVYTSLITRCVTWAGHLISLCLSFFIC